MENCLPAINVRAEVTLDPSGKKILAIGWDTQGSGSLTNSTLCSFMVNGVAAWDTRPENTQFPISTGKHFEEQSVDGGIVSGQTKSIFIRIFCKDGSHVDSATITYQIPNTIPQPVIATPSKKKPR